MNVVSTSTPVTESTADAVVIFHHADTPLAGPTAELDRASGGRLQQLLEAGEFSGKKCETLLIPALAGAQARLVLIAGLGAREKCESGTLYKACGAAARALSGKKLERVAFYGVDGWSDAQSSAALAGAMNGCVGQDLYRAKKGRHPFTELAWWGSSAASISSGVVLGEAVALARRLVNEPANVMYPASFALEAERLAAAFHFGCEVWDEHRLAAERCGALLAVGRAASQPARLVVLRYQGAAASQPPLALVGKGVTFDSGGLSIKPTDGMKTMKCDMAGAATVLAAVTAIARLKLPVNVVGLCGLVENMLGGDSYKVGDVLTARNGKTIEVLNTDAEGRLVLADVLDVALEQQPGRIVDLATLTGACLVALGTDVAGVMSNHDAWQAEVIAAAHAAGEALWPLPMFPEYAEHIKSEVADIKNTGDGRWAGATAGAKFLEEFVDGKPWVHLDIAGPAFLESPKPWQDGGGTGCFVRTLVELARRYGSGH
jgi:leucyl aminopeptidase